MSKFEEVKLKVEAYCAANPVYRPSIDEKKSSILIEGGKESILVSFKDGKPSCSDPEFWEKVFDFQMDETSEGGYLAVPIDDESKTDIVTLLGEVGNGKFSGLKVETVRNYLCPTATPQEFLNFLMEASVIGVNPFIKGEFYFIKDKNGTVRHQVGVQALKRRAAQSSDFRGYKCGVIVMKKGNPDGDPIYKETEFVAPNETLVGGWCDVYLKDDPEPKHSAVSLEEYDSGMALYKTKKATMIVKTAVAHGLRKEFPIECAGMYVPDEMGHPTSDVIDVESTVVS